MSEQELSIVLRAARQALTERRVDEAIALLNGLDRQFLDSHEVASTLGVAYAENRNYTEALTCFERAVSVQATARGYYNIATLHRMQGNLTATRTALLEALRLDAQYEKARQMLAQLDAVPPDQMRQAPSKTPDPAAITVGIPPIPTSQRLPLEAALRGTVDPNTYAAGRSQAMPQPTDQSRWDYEKNWRKVVLGGTMVGIPSIILCVAWTLNMTVALPAVLAVLIALGLVVMLDWWLASNTGAFEWWHWIIMIVFTGLIPALVIMKGFEILLAGYCRTEKRQYEKPS
jgi:tetratricopeptide (TPR) repeat protein